MKFFDWLWNTLRILINVVFWFTLVLFIIYWVDSGSWVTGYNKSVGYMMEKLNPVNISGEISDVTGVEIMDDKRIWHKRKGTFYYINSNPVLHYHMIKGETVRNAYSIGCISEDEKEMYLNELLSIVNEYYSDDDPTTIRSEYLLNMNDATLLEISSRAKQFSDPLIDRCGYEIIDGRDEHYFEEFWANADE